MAFVIGPNGVKTFVPDNVARSLVGNGKRGYRYAPTPAPATEPATEKPKPAPRKRASRKRVAPKPSEE